MIAFIESFDTSLNSTGRLLDASEPVPRELVNIFVQNTVEYSILWECLETTYLIDFFSV